jgi:acyl carrier protein
LGCKDVSGKSPQQFNLNIIFVRKHMDIRSAVRNFLKDKAPKGVSFTDSDNLLAKGVIDSLRMLDMISFLEEEYHLKIDEDELMPENFESVEAIARFVEQRIKT